MMWQVGSGSYYNRINEEVSYSSYLHQATEALHSITGDEASVKLQQIYEDIKQVRS